MVKALTQLFFGQACFKIFHCFDFLVFAEEVGTDQECNDTNTTDHHKDRPEPNAKENRNTGGNKGRKSGQEPAADHRHYTGNSVNSSLSVPRTVCQRTTHGNHESNVSRRKRKFHAGSRSNQDTGEYEIDGSTNLVKRQRNLSFLNTRFLKMVVDTIQY